MHAYPVVLFIHLLALLLATGAAVLTFFAALQMRGATALADLARWGRVTMAVLPCFPAATVLLAGSGAYMTQTQWHWTTPWIDAGIAGLVLLVGCGSGVEARRRRALERELRAAGLSQRARGLLRDPVAWSTKVTTLTLMLAVVFLMVTKPGALGSGLTLVAALLLGPLAAAPFWRSPARDTSPVPAGAGLPGASRPLGRQAAGLEPKAGNPRP